jgi:hypothetical protein
VVGTSTGGSGGYDLDGDGTIDTSTAAFVVEAVIYGASAQDALEVSERLDGKALSESTAATADVRGRVRYAAPTSGTVDALYIYIAHR